MIDDTNHPQEGVIRFPLGLKLALALFLLVAVKMVFLFGMFGPNATESFLERSDRLIALSREALREMVLASTEDSKDLLVNLINHTMDARKRWMMDLPLSLYRDDVERIRRVVERSETQRGLQLTKNVGILAEEMELRSLRKVDRRLERLAQEQASLGAAFASDIRRAYLILTGVVFSALLLVLGFGLYRTVVYPLSKLRKGTRAVARGDLEVEVPVRSADEVGGLSADFAGMVRQLRDSRESVRRKNLELEDLNRNLESEVSRKTRHLERTLDDLRRTQRQLIHAEKMASIGTLAGGVAHEFNNLIGGIRGCAAEALETEKDPDRRETLEVILRTTDRAGEITDQLLRFSRQRAMKMEHLDVTKALEESLRLIEPDARKRKVRIVRRIAQGPALPADGDALHQVFLNLLTNALQAMPGGGELAIDAEATERELLIRIEDTGVGIPADHLGRIFEPFFTTKDQDLDPTQRGSGLGLSVSYSIIEAHGGTLAVESEMGKGSVFLVRLPVIGKPAGDESQAGGAQDG